MNWMFEPRSKDWYDDDADGEIYSPPMQWHEVPLAILYFLLFLVWSVIIELLIPVGLVVHEFYSQAKRVSESGKIDEPGLLQTGIVIGFLLLIAITHHLFDVTKHPFITICSSTFVLLFTLAPLTGLLWRAFKK